ncbi:hypothetical protein [Methanopyrus sp.]
MPKVKCFPVFRVLGRTVDLELVERVRRAIVAAMVLAGAVGAVSAYFGCGSPSVAAVAFLGPITALPVVSYVVCSHVRLEPGRLVIAMDCGFFRRLEYVPGSLIDGAEAVTVSAPERSWAKEVRVVRLHLKDRGYMPLCVGDPEALVRELSKS